MSWFMISTFSNVICYCFYLQVKAITDNIRKGTDHKPRHLEGYENQNWVLLDYFDVIVHIFNKEEREYYGLERLWADAPIMEISDDKA